MTIQILKDDNWSLVTLDGEVIKKTVRRIRPIDKIWDRSVTETVNRELKALKRLKRVEGVRKIIRREAENIFTAHYMPGTPLREYKKQLPSSYFDELSSVLKECRRRGVYNIDLNRNNLLVRYDNGDLRPGIIDFGIVLFSNEWEIPGTSIAKMYHLLRVYDLSRKYDHLQ